MTNMSLYCDNSLLHKIEVHYLQRAEKFIWADPAPFVALLYSCKLYYYYYYYYYYITKN